MKFQVKISRDPNPKFQVPEYTGIEFLSDCENYKIVCYVTKDILGRYFRQYHAYVKDKDSKLFGYYVDKKHTIYSKLQDAKMACKNHKEIHSNT